jgi:sulfite reductase (NADPH) hemoprotein beta-component
VERRISGELTEDEFKPLRLMNGLYLQLHAYMLRVAIPYGTLSAAQMRQLAYIAERWDKGYGHFTTRQNIQFNWPKLRDVPDMLDALADVGMHAIQTSGNCVRNVTADHFAGRRRTRSPTPAPSPNCCGSGPPTTPNSSSCRASSRSPSPGRPTTAR